MIKKVLSGAICIAMVFTLVSTWGCSNNNAKLGYQLDKPKKGEEVAVMDTSMGTMEIRFFKDEAPKAVENFIELSKKGYYDDLTFHRVIQNFCVQGGDPTGTGTGGQSIWGVPFENETSANLVNITGALSMANSGKDTNGSQFFFNQGGPENFIGFDYISSTLDSNKITNEYKDLYTKYGGNPTLDEYYSSKSSGYTVFGQVFEGLDVLNEIAATPVDENDKPITDVIINKVEIKTYEG